MIEFVESVVVVVVVVVPGGDNSQIPNLSKSHRRKGLRVSE